MRVPPQIRWLADGERLHLSDGPIDLIVEAFGNQDQVQTAYRAAATRFVTVLDELCQELPLLRKPMLLDSVLPTGVVARRMADAVAPFARRCFITPMAAVAGAVAEEILAAMTSASYLTRAYVNNGGDIAFSLGIADAVTVLARSASLADAAATVIANAVDLPDHPGIGRQPACELAPDSDLGSIPVTRSVGELTEDEIQEALNSGTRVAEELLASDLISSAALSLQSHSRIVSSPQHHTLHSESWSLLHA